MLSSSASFSPLPAREALVQAILGPLEKDRVSLGSVVKSDIVSYSRIQLSSQTSSYRLLNHYCRHLPIIIGLQTEEAEPRSQAVNND